MSVEQWAPLVDDVAGLWSKLARPWLRPALLATIAVESSGNARASGAAGEIGLTQILPATGIALGFEPGTLWDPRANLEAAKKLLIELWGQLGPDVDAVASAYNCGAARSGSGFVSRCRASAGYTNQAYVERWLGAFLRFGGTPRGFASQPTAAPRCPPGCTWTTTGVGSGACDCGDGATVTVTASPLEVPAAPASWLLWGVVVGGALLGAVWASRD